MRKLTLFLLLLLAVAAPSGAQGLSGDEVLARSAQEGSLTALGSRANRLDFDILNRDGTVLQRTFAFFSKRAQGQPDRLLVYFLAPELERGTIFLSVDPTDPAEPSRIWLFLSALGQVKELVSDSDRNAGFAGSSLQNDQLGSGLNYDEDYTGQLQGTETLTLRWLGQEQTRPAYKVALSRRPEAQVDFPSGTVWVDIETFVVLRGELANDGGQLKQVLASDDFVAFNEKIEPNVIAVEDRLEGSKTTITIRQRLDVGELPDEIFTPEALPSFDPAAYGVEG